jgi:acetoacetyl-CoA synthetase
MDSSREILWQPSAEDITSSRLYEYRQWLTVHHGVHFSGYESLWQWSVDHPDVFWETIAAFFKVKFHSPYIGVLAGGPMPETMWFEGAMLNYAEHVFMGMKDQEIAILFANEHGVDISVSVSEMWQEVTKLQRYFKSHGVRRGDRIAGYLPNIPQATYAFLAATSMGAIWSCCSQDFGVSSVVDRFAQIEPVLFIAADGYYYNGKTHTRLDEVEAVRQSLPSIRDTLLIDYTGAGKDIIQHGITRYDTLVDSGHKDPVFEAVPFDHPLWILYSSGTTGAPKAITHSHGGCLLEHLKYLAFHNDVHPGERFFWYSTTGWMMWNFLHGSMMLGATIVLYDGSPGYPDLDRLWALSAEKEIHHFGTSAPYLVACMKEGIHPGSQHDLTSLRSIGSTGSPLPPEAFQWVYDAVHPRVWLCSMSGGTDVCTAFVGGVIEKPVIKGEIQARGLGCALYAFDDDRQPVVDSLGEMVITKPMPSMPVYFWNDPGKKKYHASYFEDIPGVWRHGDWVRITKEGGIIIYGRSDATLNRQGVRIGTAEIYRVLNEIPDIEDGLIVNLELKGGRHYMPLFVKLSNGVVLDADLISVIVKALKSKCSPKHVPDDVIQVTDIPYTISGKKMEAPVKKILMGMETDSALNKDAMRNPESLPFFKLFKIPEEKS